MLSIILIWLYIAVICLAYGCGGAALLRILLQEGESGRLPFSLIVIFGLGVITTIVGYLSLFIKIGLVANVIMLLGALLLYAAFSGEINATVRDGFYRLFHLNRYVLILLLIIFLFVLVKSTNLPYSYDTGLYHAQALRWIAEYPGVPGLGNLHGRLAFNSAWFLPQALFSFSFLYPQSFHVLNGFFLLIIVISSMDGLSNLLQKKYNFNNILKSGLSIPVILTFKDQLCTPTPDIPVLLLICALLIYYFQNKEDAGNLQSNLISVMMVLLAVWTVTIKLSALPLVLCAGVIMGREVIRRRPVNLLLIGGLALGTVLPFFLRNIVISGYLVYPFPALDWFAFDWKIPPAEVLKEKRAIEVFARDPKGIAGQELAQGMVFWLPIWFHQTVTEYGLKLQKVFLPSLLLGLDWAYQAMLARRFGLRIGAISQNKLPFLIVAAGLIFWFLTAPDMRFGMGFFVVGAILIFMPLLQTFDFRVTKIFPWGVGLLLLYFLVAFLATEVPLMSPRLYLPAPYPQASLAVATIQGKTVYYPQGNKEEKCWNAPLPCTPSNPAERQFTFRGETLEQGFKPR